jgi:cation:H+ antiporter
MISFFLWFFILVVCAVVLAKACDYFVEYCAKMAIILQMPPWIAGILLVSAGISLPELAAAIFGAAKVPEFVSGMIIGSNIVNMSLIVGLAALFAGSVVFKKELLKMDMYTLLFSAILLFLVSLDGSVSYYEAGLLIVFYIAYIATTLKEYKTPHIDFKQDLSFGYFVTIVASLAIISVCAYFLVMSVQKLSTLFGFADTSLLALSAVAVGLALPELLVSIAAYKAKHHELLIGNIIGANIFNSLVVIGIASFIRPVLFPIDTLLIATICMVLLTIVFFLLVKEDRPISRLEGIGFLAVFVLFLIGLF